MSAVTDQYSVDPTDYENIKTVKRDEVSPKDLTELKAYTRLLEDQLSSHHRLIASLRRDINRLKDQLVAVENNLYNLRRR